MAQLKLPIGIENFKKIRTEGYYYVDKTDVIRQVIEVKYTEEGKSMESDCKAALKQIDEKNYDAELIKRGVKEENIHHYGFAFKAKEVDLLLTIQEL